VAGALGGNRSKAMKQVQKPPSQTPSVRVLRRQTAQKHEYAKDVFVPGHVKPGVLRNAALHFREPGVHPLLDGRRQGVVRARFVIQPGLFGPVGAHHRVQGFGGIGIYHTVRLRRGLDQQSAQEPEEVFLLSQKTLRQPDILVGDFFRIQVRQPFEPPRFLEIGTVERAVHGDFPLFATAAGADVPADSRAEAAGTAFLTQLAEVHPRQGLTLIVSSILMARTDLYFKVELEHGGEESLDRVVAEIDRQIRKVHGVRQVEFSNAIAWPAEPD
jgi:hypothetical protein